MVPAYRIQVAKLLVACTRSGPVIVRQMVESLDLVRVGELWPRLIHFVWGPCIVIVSNSNCRLLACRFESLYACINILTITYLQVVYTSLIHFKAYDNVLRDVYQFVGPSFNFKYDEMGKSCYDQRANTLCLWHA